MDPDGVCPTFYDGCNCPPSVSDEQALVLATHAIVVQSGFSTPEIERERLLSDAARSADPQAFIDETVAKFRAEIPGHVGK